MFHVLTAVNLLLPQPVHTCFALCLLNDKSINKPLYLHGAVWKSYEE